MSKSAKVVLVFVLNTQIYQATSGARWISPAAIAIVIVRAAVRTLTSAIRAISLTVSAHVPSGALRAASLMTPNTANSLGVNDLAAQLGS